MKCRIQDNRPNAAQRKALQQMVGTEFNKLLEKYNRQANLQYLYVLHFYFGFGQKRLQQAVDKLFEMQKDLDYRYELPEDDTPFLCELKLKESGINVDKLFKFDKQN